MFKKQGNLPSNQFLAFVLVAKWWKSYPTQTSTNRWHGFISAVFDSRRGISKEFLCSVSSKYILIQLPALNYRSHLSSNYHSKYNTKYKEMRRVRCCLFSPLLIKIPRGKFQQRKSFSCCKCVLNSAMKTIPSENNRFFRKRWWNDFSLTCFIQTEHFLMKILICSYHVQPISL